MRDCPVARWLTQLSGWWVNDCTVSDRWGVSTVIDGWGVPPVSDRWGVDNIIAALEHNDCICQLQLRLPKWLYKKFLEAAQQPLPALTSLRFSPDYERVQLDPVLDSFLGGFTPHLHTLELERIPFPGLPKLLLSATHLITLSLREIPPSGYFPPEALVTCLSGSTRLKRLVIEFKPLDLESRLGCPPPRTRTLLPVLTELRFQGDSEYLEHLVAWIDAPLLNRLDVTFSDQISDTPQLAQLISRTPNFKACDTANVSFSDLPRVNLSHYSRTALFSDPGSSLGYTYMRISCCSSSYEQASSLTRICNSSFPRALIASVESLYIQKTSYRREYDIDNERWLELLRPFTAAKHLTMPFKLVPSIQLALQELVGERAMEVLPALQTIFLEEMIPSEAPFPLEVEDAIGQIVAARQLANHPINWERYCRWPWVGVTGPGR